MFQYVGLCGERHQHQLRSEYAELANLGVDNIEAPMFYLAQYNYKVHPLNPQFQLPYTIECPISYLERRRATTFDKFSAINTSAQKLSQTVPTSSGIVTVTTVCSPPVLSPISFTTKTPAATYDDLTSDVPTEVEEDNNDDNESPVPSEEYPSNASTPLPPLPKTIPANAASDGEPDVIRLAISQEYLEKTLKEVIGDAVAKEVTNLRQHINLRFDEVHGSIRKIVTVPQDLSPFTTRFENVMDQIRAQLTRPRILTEENIGFTNKETAMLVTPEVKIDTPNKEDPNVCQFKLYKGTGVPPKQSTSVNTFRDFSIHPPPIPSTSKKVHFENMEGWDTDSVDSVTSKLTQPNIRIPDHKLHELNQRESVKVHFYRELTNRSWEVKQPIEFDIVYRGVQLLAVADSRLSLSFVSRACFSHNEVQRSTLPGGPVLTHFIEVPYKRYTPKLSYLGTFEFSINRVDMDLTVGVNEHWKLPRKTIRFGDEFFRMYVLRFDWENMIMYLRVADGTETQTTFRRHAFCDFS